MKILLSSPAFAPSVGGLETVVALLAEGFAARGHDVVVVTATPAGAADPTEAGEARVVRRPSARERLRWALWCEVYFQANVSLRELWPLLLVRRPWVVNHHSWYCRTDGHIALADRLKRGLLPFAAASIAVSHAMAADLARTWPRSRARVLPNPYRAELFHLRPQIPRDQDLLFVGRLVSDKGADLLLAALARLAARGIEPGLTIVGDGPEREPLEDQARKAGLAGRVRFLGRRRGEELARELCRHRLLVVPSRYQEPFGVVALEGIACGAVVVGSAGGGLAEAIGPCGRTFPNGDAGALAEVLAALLADPAACERLRSGAGEHLARHQPGAVADAYLAVLAEVAGRRAA
ncbi:MAG TPA: glycosyltransferase [Thermoanaerobaculia bacterium]|nr:glycosyltransferase [Thermoanaerobaculia bacterium]